MDTTGPGSRPSRRREAQPTRWRRPGLTRALLVANLVGQILIVVTGGAVRLTGSGLGCSTWPQCEPGSFTPVLHDAMSIHPYVEFGNRLVSVLLTLVAVAVAARVGLDRQRSRSFRILGVVPAVGVLAQAVIGGLSVLTELNPAVVGLHFLASMGLVAASVVLLHRFRVGDAPARLVVSPRVLSLARGLVAAAALAVVLGVLVTGSGPHSGDDEVGYRFALDPYAMSRIHAAAVWAFVAVLGAMLVSTRRGPGPLRRRSWVLAAITVAQGVIGYVQVFTGLPELLVGIHMLGAALLVAATTGVVLALRNRTSAGRHAFVSLDVGAPA